ncbi:nitrate regulatory gene2 protein [Senna tora]|uniref:Nitrate regulatory gene2 protein n=1 Tax=Senna tora TaxID=362788 RepID=A0A834X997_9FABA|nr:nitrate regulatory gene2 protein [Senna tora]
MMKGNQYSDNGSKAASASSCLLNNLKAEKRRKLCLCYFSQPRHHCDMGEDVSKLDTSPLVSICKERKDLIKSAKFCRYDFVSSFVIYLQSLLDVAHVLNQYVEQELLILDSDSDSDSDLHSLTDHDLQCHVNGNEASSVEDCVSDGYTDQDRKKVQEQCIGKMYNFQDLVNREYDCAGLVSGAERTPVREQKQHGLHNIPPPPPPPPQVSMWDFLYVFSSNNDDVHYEDFLNYSSDDFDVKKVREREGIPELEDENEQSSTKETKFDGKKLKGGNDVQLSCTKNALSNEEKKVEEKIVNDVTEKKMKDKTNKVFVSENLVASCCRMGVKEAVEEIKDEFEILFQFGKEFSEIIEVGKLPHQQPMSTKLRGFASSILGLIVSSTLTRSCRPHMPLNQTASGADKKNHQEHVRPKFCDLSTTLEQLYVWEKKLHEEVMGEEKLRILYDKKCKRLKDLDDEGAEQDKVNDTFASVRSLESEINVCVASISVISREIHKLRDCKLLPQLNKLIEGLIRLWKFMGTCHHKQFQAIKEAKSHIHILESGVREHSNSNATLRLERTILNWGICFNKFVNTKKSFLKYLNEWLHRCILQEPEENRNGKNTPPFSPSRIGAPLIFTLCNDWYHSIDSISENGVSKEISKFASSLHHVYEKQKEEEEQKERLDNLLKDYEKRLQSFYKKNCMSWNHNISSCIDVEDEVSLVGGIDDEGLASSRKILVEERARHREIIREVNDAASSCLFVGLCPIFELSYANRTNDVDKKLLEDEGYAQFDVCYKTEEAIKKLNQVKLDLQFPGVRNPSMSI